MEPHDRTTFEGVQALRFFAAGLVIVAHAMVVTQERLDAHLPLWQGGLDGVDVFFAISGFIIYLTSKGQSVRDFVLHRLFRIIPLYWIVSAVKVSFLLLAPGVALHHSFDLVYVIKSFLFIPAATSEGLIVPVHTVGWSLQFEMFFYGLFAIALAMRANPLWVVTPVLVALAIAAGFRTPSWPVWTVFCDQRVLDFAGGMFIAAFLLHRKIPPVLSVISVIVGTGLLLVAPEGSHLWPIVPSILIVGGAVSLEPYLKGRIPSQLIFLGAASYSLYLTHPLVIPAVPSVLARLHVVSAPLSISMAVIIAGLTGVCCFVWLERPLSTLLARRVLPAFGRRPVAILGSPSS